MEQIYEEKVKDFSDQLLRTQLNTYELLVGDGSPEHLKHKLEILQSEANRRWSKNDRSK